MKKNLISVKNAIRVSNEVKRLQKLQNTVSAEGKELLESIIEALKALADDPEVEYDEEAIKETVLGIVNNNEEVPEAVANAIAEKFAKMQSKMPTSDKLTPKIKNEVARAILTSSKEEVENAVNAVMVKNEITGLTFNDVIDYAIEDNFGKSNDLFNMLTKTKFSKFFYTEADLSDADTLAKQWDKTSATDKAIQELVATGKAITTAYIYKRQRVAQEDLDDLRESGGEATFLRWVKDELDRQVVNLIVLAILIGDTVNAVGERVTTFETIGSKAASDAFTTVKNPATPNTPTLQELRETADAVKNPYGKKKIAIMSSSNLATFSEFKYSGTATIMYRTKAEVAEQLGCDDIVISDLVDATAGLYAIFMLPEGYWVKEKNSLNLVYPKYERNEVNYQVERNIGGAIHDLASTSVYKEA